MAQVVDEKGKVKDTSRAASSSTPTSPNSGTSTGTKSSTTTKEKTIDDYKRDWEAAKAAGDTAAMEAAHAGAEAIRAQQGYSGGADGSQVIPLNTGNSAVSANDAKQEQIAARQAGAYEPYVAPTPAITPRKTSGEERADAQFDATYTPGVVTPTNYASQTSIPAAPTGTNTRTADNSAVQETTPPPLTQDDVDYYLANLDRLGRYPVVGDNPSRQDPEDTWSREDLNSEKSSTEETSTANTNPYKLPEYQPNDYYTPRTMEEYQAYIDAAAKEVTDNLIDANAAALQLSIDEIRNSLDNGLNEYTKAEAQAYLNKLTAQQNATLRNAVNGDLGGIGNALYDAQTAQYDAQMYQIQLERIALVNSANQQIAALKLQNRYEDAQLLAEWAQKKLDLIDQHEQELISWSQNQRQMDYAQYADQRDFTYNQAQYVLENGGTLSSDMLTSLGMTEADAANIANYINQMKDYNLKAAALQSVYKATSGSSGNSGGNSVAESSATDVPANGTVTIHLGAENKDRTYQVVNGEIQGYMPKDGDYIVNPSDGSPVYYNSQTDDFDMSDIQYTDQSNYNQMVSRYETIMGKDFYDPQTAYNEAYRLAIRTEPIAQQYANQLEVQDQLRRSGDPAFVANAELEYARIKASYDQVAKLLDNLNTFMDYFGGGMYR